MRGGAVLPDGSANLMPRRNLPWGEEKNPVPAKIRERGERGPAPVGSFSGDRSPYGIQDMAGNVAEWTISDAETGGTPAPTFRTIRGGSWDYTTTRNILSYMLDNMRTLGERDFQLGMRCALLAK